MTTDLVPTKHSLTLGPGRHHRIPHDLRDVYVDIRDRDGRTPMWRMEDGVGLGVAITVQPDEVLIDLPGEAEGLTAIIVGLPRSTG